MYGHKIGLSTCLSFMILAISLLKLVNAAAITCDPNFNSSVPIKPPNTHVGSFIVYQKFNELFSLNSMRNAYIYWQNINESDMCGTSFEYQVFCTPVTNYEKDNKTITKKTYTNYVQFEGLSAGFEYNCKIYSKNDQGLSTEYSVVIIPREYDRYQSSVSLTRIEFEEEAFFELSWNRQKDANSLQLIGYTLFWCNVKTENPYECINDLNWLNIPNSETSYNITATAINKSYRFAISVNWNIYLENEVIYRSSGMLFESCTVLANKIPAKINNIEVNVVASTNIQMIWTLECIERTNRILGYRVLYCPVVSKENSQCTEPAIENNIFPENRHPFAKILHYESVTVLAISKLQPLTTYKFTISVLVDNNEGLPSDPIFITTHKRGEHSGNGPSVVAWKSP